MVQLSNIAGRFPIPEWGVCNAKSGGHAFLAHGDPGNEPEDASLLGRALVQLTVDLTEKRH